MAKLRVIGGIYQNDTTNLESRTAAAQRYSDFMGALFRSKRKTKQKNELLVFLKPTVLKNLANSIARFDTSPDDVEQVSVDSGSEDEFEAASDLNYDDDGGAEEGFGEDEDDFADEIDSGGDGLEEEGLSEDLEEMSL